MTAVKQIPVSTTIFEELSELKRSDQSFDELLSHMVDLEKKNRLLEDMLKKEEEGDFVELTFES